jgi:predicted ATPase
MGFGTLVELVGEPGIGKSRLAQELKENCSDMRQIELRCEQYEASTPYFPFRPFVRSLLDVELNGGGDHNRAVLSERLREIDEELVPWAPLLAAPLDVDVETTPEVKDLDPSFWRARLHGVMGTLLGHLLDSPTLMVFDDVHWMDDASSELLRYLGTQLPTRPWLACTTRRPGEDGFAAATGTPPLPALTLRLEPLPEDDAKALAMAAAGDRRLSEDEVAALMERAAGNPLFLRELASVGEKTDDADDLPETVEGLVATRIDQLAPGDRALLRWASVLGVSFSGSLIAEVLEDDPNVAAGSEAWSRLAEFVERDPDVPGAFRFRHALIRDAAYDGLSFRRRRELHGRVGEVIERKHGDHAAEAAEILALHFHRAERWPETWHYSVEAGRRAEEKYANVEAAQFFEQALEANKALPDVPDEELAAVATSLGDVNVLLGRYEAANRAFKIAEGFVRDDPLQVARLAGKRYMVPFRLAKHSEALRVLSRGLRELKGVPGSEAGVERAALLSSYATVRQVQRRPLDAIEWAHKSIAEAEQWGEGAREAEAAAYYILDWAYVALGKPDQAVYGEQALAIYREIGNKKRIGAVLNHLAGRAYLEGHWDECLELAAQAQEASTAIGDRWSAAAVGFNIGETRADQGRYDEAEPVVRESMTVWKEDGALSDAAEASSLLGRILVHLGRFDEARTLLTEALATFLETGDEAEELKAEARLAVLVFLTGDNAAALRGVDGLIERAAQGEGMFTLTAALHRLKGEVLAASGRLEEARVELYEAIRIVGLPEANFGLKSTDYELGQTSAAFARLPGLDPEEAALYAAKRDEILTPLGVVTE